MIYDMYTYIYIYINIHIHIHIHIYIYTHTYLDNMNQYDTLESIIFIHSIFHLRGLAPAPPGPWDLRAPFPGHAAGTCRAAAPRPGRSRCPAWAIGDQRMWKICRRSIDGYNSL